MSDQEQPEQRAVPVLPYGPGARNEFAPPAPTLREFYRHFGMLALGLAVVAVLCVIGSVVWNGPRAGRSGLDWGCCFGLFPWLCSVLLSVILIARHEAARPWAAAALVLDALLVGLVYVFGV